MSHQQRGFTKGNNCLPPQKYVHLPDMMTSMAKHYWLFKSEPETFGVAHLAACPGKRSAWTGVRNYQARNYMRDEMSVGDLGFFYHSSCANVGIAGLVEVVSPPHPDETQFDSHSPYYDPKSTPQAPRWMCVDVRLTATTPVLTLAQMRADDKLAGMVLLKPGNRLSITPVTASHWKHILQIIKSS